MRSTLEKNVVSAIRSQKPLSSDVWSVALYHKGEEWVGSYAGSELEETDSRSLYEIGSITKVFTALLLAHEVSKGNLNLTEPVHSFFKDHLDGKKSEITLKHLATHTSGLPRLPFRMMWRMLLPKPFYRRYKQNPYRTYGETQLIQDLIKHMELDIPPSKTSNYSNFGYALLGYILTTERKQSYDDAIKEAVLSPLELKETGYLLSSDLTSKLLTGFDPKGKPVEHWEFHHFAGAGALRSSIHDLLRFAKANLHPPDWMKDAISMTHQVYVRDPEGVSVCLGWHKNERTGWLVHSGGTGGFRSFIAFHPENQQAIIVLVNRAKDTVEEVVKQLIQEWK
ncbi:serine hydrolase domain-containing protein [Melghirimyces algeriensis]|uniref:CubicO group peptidase, beta-lactamase class C family n=1 Tax=Melghirimyces algeriensis TaxID=910412 RepID=A0A521BES1_9BACL|nr:serine hydrolase domain-containing protein [Melghirimyces algeriensis]SMO45441.1 CubicO group peptidase, beta-lactamase class C family [Melghirimyces algeriensis]